MINFHNRFHSISYSCASSTIGVIINMFDFKLELQSFKLHYINDKINKNVILLVCKYESEDAVLHLIAILMVYCFVFLHYALLNGVKEVILMLRREFVKIYGFD